MRLLAALVDAADGCVGGDLAGRVWAASKVGDPAARAYATRLLQQVRAVRVWPSLKPVLCLLEHSKRSITPGTWTRFDERACL